MSTAAALNANRRLLDDLRVRRFKLRPALILLKHLVAAREARFRGSGRRGPIEAGHVPHHSSLTHQGGAS